ncbi:Uncharacterised protein [Mycobacteroides abscessus subsp. abscessus]|nr:Uncharacterised protein [Mycobacteroides abscessus subsp. abscessus]
MSRRRSTRSAITPAYGPMIRIGSACRATIRPRIDDDPLSVSTSQACAVACIHVPISETA